MPTYKPEIFNVKNLEQAKAIILTPDTSTTEQRWQHETPIVASLLAQGLKLERGQLVLDYGCGVGRLARELIAKHQCGVVGVDISLSMIQLAPGYVASNAFAAMPPLLLDLLVTRGLQFDTAYAVWVIQHCLKPQEDLTRIASALKPGGIFQMFNCINRCIPTDKGWANDGIDLVPILKSLFAEVSISPVPAEIEPKGMPGVYYCAICRK